MKTFSRIIGITAVALFAWLAVYSYHEAMACDPLCHLIKKSEREYEAHKEREQAAIVYLYGAAYE
jgi:hypothetical protein